jgi:hypothetical protein
MTARYIRSATDRAIVREAARYGVRSLLAYDSDPKTSKSNAASDEWYTVISYMAPHTLGGHDVCHWSTPGCRKDCLFTAGNPVYMKTKVAARLNRKRLFFEDRPLYLDLLRAELREHQFRAASIGRKIAARLNGTSDNPLEILAPELFREFPHVQFYDYTKSPYRLFRDNLPANYALTFSRSETNHDHCLRHLEAGHRVAIVFSTRRGKPLPESYLGFPVVDQDTDDLTFLRDGGQWLGLRAKGAAILDTGSGFVVDASSL